METRSMKRKITENLKKNKEDTDSDDNLENIDDLIDILKTIKKVKTKLDKNIIDKDYTNSSDNSSSDEESDSNESLELTDESESEDIKEDKKEDKNNEFKILEKNLFDINKDTLCFKYKILKSNFNDETKRIIIENINSFNKMSKTSSDYNKLKSWIDTIEKIPFNKYVSYSVTPKSSINDITKFLLNLQENLNNCIYGQEDAKDSILQIITQNITNPTSTGSVIALKGPPGVGKTSLIKNGLSKALNTPFSFVSLSGVNDVSYFDGFSYTYEGSRHGKMADILIKANCMNPIIFFDELDKISFTEKGQEISNLLIHLTDFSQNNSFEDKYLGPISLDFSRVIFVFSLNNENLINPVLKDRLQIVNLKGFNNKDKIKIALEYLIPSIIKNIGIKDKIIIDKECILHIIEKYSNKEEGVRNLKRSLEILLRRINILKYSKGLNLKYQIKNIKFPLTILTEHIDILLKENKIETNTSLHMMYL